MTKRITMVILLVIFTSGCINQTTVSPQEVSTVTVQATSLPAESTNEWRAYIVFSRGRHELSESVSVAGNSLSLTVQIPVGTWDISMLLVDQDDTPHYQDTITDVTVFPDQPLNLDFQLQPAQGLVSVIVDLANFPQAENILRVRVHFNDDVKEIKRDFPDEPLVGEYQLSPGSHDFNVELFTDSFRSTDKVDNGLWQVINIEPLSEQTFIWTPALENLTISADIHSMPSSPTNLQANYHQSKISLTWEHSQSDFITEYQIYWQPDPFTAYEHIGTVPASQSQFTHDLTELTEIPQAFNYSIAASSEVITGYRTPPLIVTLD